MAGHLERYGAFALVFLVAVIIGGGVMLAVNTGGRTQPIEILPPPTSPGSESPAEVHVAGAVANSGIYPLQEDDTIPDILQAAGGIAPEADSSKLIIRVPTREERTLPQKVNLNTAEAWLLQALPGIGPSRAQAIVTYRSQHGGFRQIEDLIEVEGIGQGIFDKIKDLITVTD